VRATAIVLAHGTEPSLDRCVGALADDPAVSEILVVDNEARASAVAAVSGLRGVRLLAPGTNLGFAGGCDYAATHATGDVLVFVNSDAVVQPGAVAALVRRLGDPQIGLVGATARLADRPELLNTAGNPVHYLMFSWVGGLGEPAPPLAAEPWEVASVSGVTFAVRREVWEQLGGFDAQYFAYCEDVDLSLRAWQAGYRVVVEPGAVVWHHYEYARTPAKQYLLERNRLINLLTLPERRTRRLVAAPALVVEAGVVLVAVRDGWWRDKLAGWRWLAGHRPLLAERRRRVEAGRRVGDRQLAPRLLRGALDPPEGVGVAVPALVSCALDRYWGWAVTRL
jgi:GT2 family glycosyltransferase